MSKKFDESQRGPFCVVKENIFPTKTILALSSRPHINQSTQFAPKHFGGSVTSHVVAWIRGFDVTKRLDKTIKDQSHVLTSPSTTEAL